MADCDDPIRQAALEDIMDALYGLEHDTREEMASPVGTTRWHGFREAADVVEQNTGLARLRRQRDALLAAAKVAATYVASLDARLGADPAGREVYGVLAKAVADAEKE